MPALQVLLSFDDASDPSPSYIDFSDRARSFRIETGRDNEQAEFDTAHGTVVLADPDGLFVPWNRQSPFWPNVVSNRRLKLIPEGEDKFEGYVDTFTPTTNRWGDAVVQIDASDAQKPLEHDHLPASNPPGEHADVLLFDSPYICIPFEEPATSLEAQDIGPNGYTSRSNGLIGGGQSSLLTGSTSFSARPTACQWTDREEVLADNPGYFGSLGTLTFGFLFDTGTLPGADDLIIQGPINALGLMPWGIYISPSGQIKFRTVTPTSGVTVCTSATHAASSLLDVKCVLGRSDRAFIYVNGVKEFESGNYGGTALTALADLDQGMEITAGTGQRIGWFTIYPYAMTEARILAQYESARLMGYNEQLTGARLASIFGDSSVPITTDLDAGTEFVQPVRKMGQSVLDELRRTAKAEGGDSMFFFAGSGAATFLDADHRLSAPHNVSQGAFSDIEEQIPVAAGNMTLSGNEITDATRAANLSSDGRPFPHVLFDGRPREIEAAPSTGFVAPFNAEYNTANALSNQLKAVDADAYGYGGEVWYEGTIRSTDDVGSGGTNGRILLSNAAHAGTGQFATGAEYWEIFTEYFPADYVTSPSGVGGVNGDFNIFFEHHHTGSVFQSQAPVRFAVMQWADGRPSTFYVFIRGGTDNGTGSLYTTHRVGRDQVAEVGVGTNTFSATPAPYEFEREARFDFKIHTVNGSTGTGLLEVWQRKNLGPWKKWFSYAGPNMYAGLEEYKEHGLYRKAFATTSRILFGGYKLAASEYELEPIGGGDDSFGVFAATTNVAPLPLTGWAPFSGAAHALVSDPDAPVDPDKVVEVSYVSGANGVVEQITVTFGSAGVKTVSFWLECPVGYNGSRPIGQISGFTGATNTADFYPDAPLVHGEYFKYQKTFTVAAGDLTGTIDINRGGTNWAAGDKVRIAGFQAVDGAVDMPYTRNGVARGAARVRVPTADVPVTPTLGAVVMRIVPAYASGAGVGQGPGWLQLLMDANNYLNLYWDDVNLRWNLHRHAASAGGDAVLADSFLRYAEITVAIGWTSTTARISVDGSVPSGGAIVTGSSMAGSIPSLFDLGSLGGAFQANGWIHWAIGLSQFPTNAELLLYAALGRFPGQLGSLPNPAQTLAIIPFGDSRISELQDAVPYESSEIDTSDAFLFNEARKTRIGGTTQVAVNTASQRRHNPSVLPDETDLLLISDAAALAQAQADVEKYGEPLSRIKELVLNLSDPDALAQAIAREVGDRITVAKMPHAGDQLIQDSWIQQRILEGEAGPGGRKPWKTTFRVSPL